MMLTGFSKAKAFLLFLAIAILCLSISTLGLSGHGIAYYLGATTGGQWDYVKIHIAPWNYTSQTSTHYVTHIAYDPVGSLDLTDMYAMLVAGIIGTLLGIVIIVASLQKGNGTVNISLTGRTVRSVNLLGSTTALLLDAALLLTFIIVAGYTWARAYQTPYWIDPNKVADPQDRLSYYKTGEHFTYESWSCALARATTADAMNPNRAELFGQCMQARVAREVMLALFVLGLMRLGAHYWVWRAHNVAVRLAKEEERGRGSKENWDRIGSEDGRERTRNRRASQSSPAVELPAYRLSRVEAPETAVGEMPGEDGSKEMQAETVAREMDASRRQSGEKT